EVDDLVRAHAAAVLGVRPQDVPSSLSETSARGAQAVADVLATCAEGLYAASSPDAPAQGELIRRAVAAVEQMTGRADAAPAE
ncbi:hypothetical protein HOI71_24295, partial [Candidatus Poribacteria bacterium]|nr:hypothetical protein [Candidatus Poribacteria bacterium]